VQEESQNADDRVIQLIEEDYKKKNPGKTMDDFINELKQ